jgi:hypothetical protein
MESVWGMPTFQTHISGAEPGMGLGGI